MREITGKRWGQDPALRFLRGWDVGRGFIPAAGVVSIPFLRCGGVGAAAARLPGRRIRRPYGQTMKRQFPPAGSRPRPTGEPGMYRCGGSGTPEFKVENRKNRWKNSLSRRFSRFFRFDFFFGGLGGVQPQSRAPRLGSSGGFFGSFLAGQKGTYPGKREPTGKPHGRPIGRPYVQTMKSNFHRRGNINWMGQGTGNPPWLRRPFNVAK